MTNHALRQLRHRVRDAVSPECGWPERLRRNRRRVAWSAAILAVVSVPLVILALVGLPHVFRNPLVRNVIARGVKGVPAPGNEARFADAFTLLTGTTLTAGNTVEVLANGDATFSRIWLDLRAAQRSITVQMYYAGPGAVADSVTRILAERSRSGVDV